MTYSTAMALCRKNIDIMSLEQLQHHKVRLTDAWRESKAEYGFAQAVKDGFYQIMVDSGASGFTPLDVWLTNTIENRLDQTENKLNQIYKELKIK